MEGRICKGNTLGLQWDNALSKIIQERVVGRKWFKEPTTKGSKEPKPKREPSEPLEVSLLEEIFNEFEINLVESQFPLYGFMYDKTEAQPKIYYWEGDADAIGWYNDPNSGEGRYVIVDWKVLGDIATFWKDNSDAYGKYLHQCLVYARLFQLQMDLNYLPHILIVPISGVTGKDLHPGLFFDYPKECTDVIEGFQWSLTQPEPPIQIPLKKPFNEGKLRKGEEVNPKMLLADFFAKDATVEDLMNVFGWPSLQVISIRRNNFKALHLLERGYSLLDLDNKSR